MATLGELREGHSLKVRARDLLIYQDVQKPQQNRTGQPHHHREGFQAFRQMKIHVL